MRARINGLDMHYLVSGREGLPAVILHHPLATDLSSWDELTAALEPTMRVVRFDARGHGRSEAPKGPYDFRMLSADVIGLMDHLGISRARFVGLSMGGMVGQYLGVLHPERFSCLSLVSTASKTAPQGVPIWDERIKIAGSVGMAGVVDGAIQRWVAPEVQAGSDPTLMVRLKRMLTTTPADGYIGWCQAIRELDITGRLAEIRVPTQVIVGALDPATPPAAAEVIHSAIPGSELVVLPGVSHMLQLEKPAQFHAAQLPFLAKH